MADREALMRAVVEHPEQDMPRLALADWFDEYGDEADRAHAAFIRAQIQKGDDHAHAEFCLLEQRDRHRFYRQLPRKWIVVTFRESESNWRPKGPPPLPNFAFLKRGFIERVCCSGEEWVRHSGLLTGQHPVREVDLTSWPKLRSCHEGLLKSVRYWIDRAVPHFSWKLSEKEINLRFDNEIETDVLRKLLKLTWEKIKFTVPPSPTELLFSDYQQLYSQVLQALGIPAHLAGG